MNQNKEIRRTPLLDRYIQSTIAEQMNELEEKRIAEVIRGLINADQVEPKKLN